MKTYTLENTQYTSHFISLWRFFIGYFTRPRQSFLHFIVLENSSRAFVVSIGPFQVAYCKESVSEWKEKLEDISK